LLTSHIRPDCDALGSELGMAGVLRALGKQVVIVNGQTTPPNLAFIDPRGELKAIDVDIKAEDLADIEVLMVLDTSAWAQLGPMGAVVRETKAHKLILDHHVGQDDLGAELFKDTTAEATGRLVAEAAVALGVPLTPEMAMPLFAALATDTGWFRFGSTSPLTMRTAATLIEAGAKPSELYSLLYEQDTLARLQLRGRILARAQSELDGRLIHTAVLAEDFAATQAHPSDTEDAINLTLGVAGTLVAVILVAQAAGGYKISFRSRTPKVDCNQLAKLFGGGGHKAAAGAFLNEPFETAQAKVLGAARAALA
jgi:phosphoesterase RecJ-like protein